MGSLALVSVPTIISSLAGSVRASDEDEDGAERLFTFVALSKAMTIGSVVHTVAMEGAGRFDPVEGEVKGGGSFVHFNNDPALPKPKPIIAFGKWKAKTFVSYTNPPGSYGRIDQSIVEMKVDLFPEGAPKVSGATLRIICNIGAAGLTTGEEEGYKLTIPGAPFGTFEPFDPPLGLSHISIPVGD